MRFPLRRRVFLFFYHLLSKKLRRDPNVIPRHTNFQRFVQNQQIKKSPIQLERKEKAISA